MFDLKSENSKLMTEHEKADTIVKSIEMHKAGQIDKADELRRTVPLQPWLAKFIKEKLGASFLIDNGYNLAEAEVEYGPDWLAS